MYADDAMHGVVHESACFVVKAIAFTDEDFNVAAERHGLLLNFGTGKTEAILALRATGSKMLKKKFLAMVALLLLCSL